MLTLDKVNDFFGIVFFVEMILKIMALGWTQYWWFDWNKFDFIVVLTTAIIFCIDNFSSNVIGVNISVLRIFRAFRGLRLLPSINIYIYLYIYNDPWITLE